MPPVGFEPTLSAHEGPHTYALDRAATGTGNATIIAVCKCNSAPFKTVEQISERASVFTMCTFPFLTQWWVELPEFDVTFPVV